MCVVCEEDVSCVRRMCRVRGGRVVCEEDVSCVRTCRV